MNTTIEEIRKRIKAASDNTDEAGPYDEYESGQRVGLATALQIIDEVVKEHPVPDEEIEGIPQEVTLIPSNEDEAAEMAARRAYPYEGGTKGDICETSIPIFCKGFKAGIAYERERLMKGAVEGEIVKDISGKLGVTAKVNLDGFKFGEKVSVIIEEINQTTLK